MTTVSAGVLRLLSDVVTPLADEVRVLRDDDGWNVALISRDHVAMARVHIAGAMFSDYESGEPVVMDCDALHEALRHVGETVEVAVGAGSVTLTSDRLVQHIPLLNDTGVDPRNPVFTPEASVMTDVEPLRRLLKAAGDSAEFLRLKVGEEGLVMSSLTRRDQEVSIDVPADECLSLAGAAAASYPASFVRTFVSVLPKGAVTEMAFAADRPLTMTYGSDADVSVKWVLAPRVEEE